MIELTSAVLRRMPLPDPEDGDKRARGDVLVIGGSAQIPGAALLAGVAALRAGAGRLRIATCSRNAHALAVAVPEAFVLGLSETQDGGIDPASADTLVQLSEEADAVLVGPGLADQAAIDAVVGALLELAAPGTTIVLDALAIKSIRNVAAIADSHAHRIVLTPHAGEMAGLLGRERNDIEADPAPFAREASVAFNATVALKGSRTFIAGLGDASSVCRQGNVGLATSGSGDVLAGVIAGLLARGADPFCATCWGVYLHATAGDRLANRIGPLGFLAREILPEIPGIMAELNSRH